LGGPPKIGRVDPVEFWGGGCDDPEMGLAAFVKYMSKAMAWDRASIRGVRCFQTPAVAAKALGLPLETAVHVTKAAHTIPGQMGRILDMTKPRMAALWHLDVGPCVGGVFEEVGEHYGGAVAVCQDLTVFNVTSPPTRCTSDRRR